MRCRPHRPNGIRMAIRVQIQAFDDSLPLSQASTIPAQWYFDPEIAQAEHRSVFTDSWMAIGRSEVLSEPGHFLTAEIAGKPLLACRDEEGGLRAFYNVCRHRAARVAVEDQGCASRFRCPYHGWTYDLQGRLRGAPEFEGVEGFDRAKHGLPSLSISEWEPFVFVKGGGPKPDLSQWLAPLIDHLEPLGLGKLRFVGRRSYDIACNWKVFIDNYLDGGYHIPLVHPGLAGALDYALYRNEMGSYASLQTGPMSSVGAKGETKEVVAVRKGSTAYYGWVFPNFMINAYEGYMDTNLVLPLSADRCRVVYDYYFEPSVGEAEIEKSIAVSDAIQLEDGHICEEVQRGLLSGAFDTGRYSVKREEPVYHFHCLLARCLRELCK